MYGNVQEPAPLFGLWLSGNGNHQPTCLRDCYRGYAPAHRLSNVEERIQGETITTETSGRHAPKLCENLHEAEFDVATASTTRELFNL